MPNKDFRAPSENRIKVEFDDPKSSKSIFGSIADLSRYSNQIKANNKISNEDVKSEVEKSHDGRLQVKVDDDSPNTLYSANEENSHVRKISIVKPVSYNNVDEITKSLKEHDIVVLSLKLSSPKFSMRILDFAFGAASMCNARVSLASEKTYLFVKGDAITQEEKVVCMKQGIKFKD